MPRWPQISVPVELAAELVVEAVDVTVMVDVVVDTGKIPPGLQPCRVSE